MTTEIQSSVPSSSAPGHAAPARDDRPGRALIEASAGADQVVVGSRGRGGFTGLLLGSASQSVLERATCPVAVARAHRDKRDRERGSDAA